MSRHGKTPAQPSIYPPQTSQQIISGVQAQFVGVRRIIPIDRCGSDVKRGFRSCQTNFGCCEAKEYSLPIGTFAGDEMEATRVERSGCFNHVKFVLFKPQINTQASNPISAANSRLALRERNHGISLRRRQGPLHNRSHNKNRLFSLVRQALLW